MTADVRMLDCTLRDGGYYTNWDFDRILVEKYVEAIRTLPVDIIEIGYRSPPKDEYLGEYFYLPGSTVRRLHKKVNGEIDLALMLNAKDCRIDNVASILNGCHGLVKLIRFAIDPDNVQFGIDLAKEVKLSGFDVSLNLMYLHKLISDASLFESICRFLENEYEAIDYVYFVDSYGSCLPDQVRTILAKARQRIPQMIGFHGHDNINLAFANTLAAIAAGVDIVDGTVLGMGRGAGNLKTELLVAYLSKYQGVLVDFTVAGELFEEFNGLRKKYEWGTSIPYMISGFENLPQKEIMEWIGRRRYSTQTIVKMLQGNLINKPKLPVYPDIGNWAKNQLGNINTAIVVGGGKTAIRHRDTIEEYATYENAVIIQSSLRNVNAYNHCESTQIVCLAGQEANKITGQRKEVRNISAFIVSSAPRFEQHFPQPWQEKVFTVDPLWPNSNNGEGGEDSPLSLALAVACALNVNRVLLTGFDGYPEEKGGAKLLAQEVQLTIDRFLRDFPKITLQSITPTLYRIPQSSIYALLGGAQ